MSLRRLVVIFINLLLCNFIYSSNNSIKDTNFIKKDRIIIVGSVLSASTLGSYFYVKNKWWDEKHADFHFDRGTDLTYALNVDKAGHFIGGLQFSDGFSSAMIWAGMNRQKSYWYGALFGSSIQLAIEIKDGYAPYWGFSTWDLAAGSIGSLWPVSQYYYSDLQAINFKFSYYKRSDIYWQLETQRGKEVGNYVWQDDYVNQTYWATFDLNHYINNCCWPEWLNLAVGFGLDDNQYLKNGTKMGGNNEWYIALDYDISKLLKKWQSPLGRNIKFFLKYFHLPAPTIRIFPDVEFYPLFL